MGSALVSLRSMITLPGVKRLAHLQSLLNKTSKNCLMNWKNMQEKIS